MRVTTDEPASEILLKASAMIATEPAIIPSVSLPIKSRILRSIPVTPARFAYFPRTFEFAVSLFLPMNSRIKKFVITVEFP